jgi:alkylation response protein AidB-like acyl-CoA dehydrogenase
MQFAFTEEQDLLRREAREVLANGGWGREELDELAFLDRAVVFEEAGRANRGDEFFDSAASENEQLAALALEAAGIARRALELGVEHAKTREQFGRPIGTFQALKHRCADLAVEVSAARATAQAAVTAATSAPGSLPVLAPLAKRYCVDVFCHVTAEMIQLHGGIGFTWEHEAHRYFKRAKTSQLLLGTPAQLRRLIAHRAGLF